jgi:methionine synthase II (cobalamin-independent)
VLCPGLEFFEPVRGETSAFTSTAGSSPATRYVRPVIHGSVARPSAMALPKGSKYARLQPKLPGRRGVATGPVTMLNWASA